MNPLDDTAPRSAVSRRAGGRPNRSIRRPGNTLVAAAFLAPALIALIALRLVPAGSAVRDSLFKTSLVAGGERFVGIENYVSLFTNPDFQNALIVTLIFTLVVNPLQVGVATLLAVL